MAIRLSLCFSPPPPSRVDYIFVCDFFFWDGGGIDLGHSADVPQKRNIRISRNFSLRENNPTKATKWEREKKKRMSFSLSDSGKSGC